MGWFSKIMGGGKPHYELNETYLRLREQALGLARAGLPALELASGPVAVVMDVCPGDHCYTFLAAADGALSLYLSAGGGIIGTGNYERPGLIARELVRHSERYLSLLKPTDEFPLPGPGRVSLHLVTTRGVFRAEEKEDSLGNDRVPLSPWFHEIHRLIAVIRETSEMKKREPPLVFAAEMGLTSEAADALAGGAAPNSLSSDGSHVLRIACTSGSVDVARLLLDAGANIEAVDPTGLTPLHLASYLGYEELAKCLIERRANLEAREDSRYTPLMMAANAGREKLVLLLLENGANPNAEDSDRSTPVMFAAQHGYVGIVKLLLDAGASPSAVGTHGFGALDFAKQNGHDDIAKLLTANR